MGFGHTLVLHFVNLSPGLSVGVSRLSSIYFVGVTDLLVVTCLLMSLLRRHCKFYVGAFCVGSTLVLFSSLCSSGSQNVCF